MTFERSSESLEHFASDLLYGPFHAFVLPGLADMLITNQHWKFSFGPISSWTEFAEKATAHELQDSFRTKLFREQSLANILLRSSLDIQTTKKVCSAIEAVCNGGTVSGELENFTEGLEFTEETRQLAKELISLFLNENTDLQQPNEMEGVVKIIVCILISFCFPFSSTTKVQ